MLLVARLELDGAQELSQVLVSRLAHLLILVGQEVEVLRHEDLHFDLVAGVLADARGDLDALATDLCDPLVAFARGKVEEQRYSMKKGTILFSMVFCESPTARLGSYSMACSRTFSFRSIPRERSSPQM